MNTCISCGIGLDALDVGAYRKLVDKSACGCMCRDCLAKKLNFTREYLDGMILMYRKRGCMLFPPLENFE